MSKLEILIDQTKFLLDQQKEAQKDCSTIFEDFINSIDKAAQSCKVAEDTQSFEKIHNLVSEQAKQLDEETQQDVDFLAEQYKMLSEIQKVSKTDEAKARELFSMVFDEQDELLDMEEFKKNVLDETALSKQNLLRMVEDIKESLQEGGVKEVELLLEAMISEQANCDDSCECGEESCECDDSYDDEDDDEEDSCCSGKNHSCKGCSSSCGSAKDEADIFAQFHEYAKSAEEQEKKTKK